jgi:Putative auto-transporter adhesin, head GIN domain
MKVNIKRLLSAKLFFPFLFLLCSFKQEKESNLQKSPVVKKELKIAGSFKNLMLEGNILVVLTNDAPGTIIVEGKEKLVNKIRGILKNDTLTVDLMPNHWFAKLTIYLSATTLQSLQLNGDGKITSVDFIKSAHLNISLNGNINVKVKTLGQLSFDTPDDIELLKKQSLFKMKIETQTWHL